MDTATLQGYAYFISLTVLVVALYWYIWYLYTGKKKRGVDYERYSDLALKDELDDAPVERMDDPPARPGRAGACRR